MPHQKNYFMVTYKKSFFTDWSLSGKEYFSSDLLQNSIRCGIARFYSNSIIKKVYDSGRIDNIMVCRITHIEYDIAI
jgi:hypothetical protein